MNGDNSKPSASLLRGDSFTDDSNAVLRAGDVVVEVKIWRPVSKSRNGCIDESKDRGLHAADDDLDVWVTSYFFWIGQHQDYQDKRLSCGNEARQ